MSYADLKNKVFFITGAASGQGRATSLALARQGAKLGLLDLNDPQEIVAEVEKLGSEAIGFKVDVT
ncbi:dehydrogenase, partial [Penicillium maclennaniae]|uniref:dehydrogenase n=1 Tax=Penicillium maclennaniae TaxID=1343394 RepID=UPI0025416598